jgi:hypothetical protein
LYVITTSADHLLTATSWVSKAKHLDKGTGKKTKPPYLSLLPFNINLSDNYFRIYIESA